jgi:hypothetical protein
MSQRGVGRGLRTVGGQTMVLLVDPLLALFDEVVRQSRLIKLVPLNFCHDYRGGIELGCRIG